MNRDGSRRRRLSWCLNGLAMVVIAARAATAAAQVRAESVLMFPHGGDAGLQALRDAAHDSVVSALAEQGLELREIGAHDAGARAGECRQIGCAPVLLAAAHADLAVAVAVWRSDTGPQVNVTLVDARGNRFPAVAAIEPAGAPAAARRALLDARGLQLLGPGPWVHVEGVPEGATVIIDGAFAGTLPYRGALSSGDHVLELQAKGHAAQRRDLQMPLDPTATTRVEIALAPGGAPSDVAAATAASRSEVAEPAEPANAGELAGAPPPDAREEASVWNYVIGGVAIVGGIAVATIDPLRAAARDGECVDAACDRKYAFGGDSALKVVAGVALVGAGATVMIWRPIRVQAQVGERSAMLAVHGSF